MRRRRGLLILTALLVGILGACNGNDDYMAADLAEDRDEAHSLTSGEDSPAAELDEISDSAPSATQIDAGQFDRRVIRTGELELGVSDVNAATRNARETVADYGGFEASSAARLHTDDQGRASITFEVPAESFEAIMSDLRDGSQVVQVEHEATSSQDVTEEYVDLKSQLTNLQATEARFLDLLDDAHTISDVLSVESEITRVRGEIERIQGRINYLEQRTDYSRIHVDFVEVEDEEEVVAGSGFNPGETAREAWNQSIEFVGSIASAMITVVVFFWWGWPLLGLGLLVFRHYRRRQPVEQSA
jgi:hypothetical protein